jgi:hypothetical protein
VDYDEDYTNEPKPKGGRKRREAESKEEREDVVEEEGRARKIEGEDRRGDEVHTNTDGSKIGSQKGVRGEEATR